MNNHDDMLDAFRYALDNLIPKLTLWQKIVRWFKRLRRRFNLSEEFKNYPF